jgi:hypothetical protein
MGEAAGVKVVRVMENAMGRIRTSVHHDIQGRPGGGPFDFGGGRHSQLTGDFEYSLRPGGLTRHNSLEAAEIEAAKLADRLSDDQSSFWDDLSGGLVNAAVGVRALDDGVWGVAPFRSLDQGYFDAGANLPKGQLAGIATVRSTVLIHRSDPRLESVAVGYGGVHRFDGADDLQLEWARQPHGLEREG